MGPLGVAIVGGLIVAAGAGAYTVLQTQSKIKNDCEAIAAMCEAASMSRPDIVSKLSGRRLLNSFVYVKECIGEYSISSEGKECMIGLYFSNVYGYWAEIRNGFWGSGGQAGTFTWTEPVEVDCKEFRAYLVKQLGLVASAGGSLDAIDEEYA